jgi:hypothetical protein
MHTFTQYFFEVKDISQTFSRNDLKFMEDGATVTTAQVAEIRFFPNKAAKLCFMYCPWSD